VDWQGLLLICHFEDLFFGNVDRCGPMSDVTKRNQKSVASRKRGGLRFWITLAVVFLILFMIGLGQWDLAMAGFIGLVVANGLGVLFGDR
jgi:pheromone shutdown protein TraB